MLIVGIVLTLSLIFVTNRFLSLRDSLVPAYENFLSETRGFIRSVNTLTDYLQDSGVGRICQQKIELSKIIKSCKREQIDLAKFYQIILITNGIKGSINFLLYVKMVKLTDEEQGGLAKKFYEKQAEAVYKAANKFIDIQSAFYSAQHTFPSSLLCPA